MKHKLYDDIHLAILRSNEKIELFTNYSLFGKKLLPFINQDDAFEMLFLNLFERNICDYLIQRKQGLNTNEYSLSVLAYRELFSSDGLHEETERIIEEHIRFIIGELKLYDEIEFETKATEIEIYYTHLNTVLNSFIRAYGTEELKNTSKFFNYFKDITGNAIIGQDNDFGEVQDFCAFLERLNSKDLDYPNDMIFLQPLYKSIRECGVEYALLRDEYENMLNFYGNMFENQIFNIKTEEDDYFDEDTNEDDINDFESMLKEAKSLLKTGNPNDALRILNILLNDENNYPLFSDIYYEISRCYQAKKDFVTALIKIEKAIELAPSSPIFHWMKGVYTCSNGNYLDYFVEGFKALKLSTSEKAKEFFSIDMLKSAESLFRYFSVDSIKDYDFSKYIDTFKNLSELEIIPNDIRQKYKNYMQDCIQRLKQKINEDTFMRGDAIYDVKMNLCKQFLSIESINIHERIKVIKQYSENKSIMRFYYGYRLNEEIPKIDETCKTGTVVLENGEIKSKEDVKETDLTIGVILHTENKLLVIDSYEYEYSSSVSEAVESNGWHLATSEELKILNEHKDVVNASLEKITGANLLEGKYKDKNENELTFSKNESNSWGSNEAKSRFVKEINLPNLE